MKWIVSTEINREKKIVSSKQVWMGEETIQAKQICSYASLMINHKYRNSPFRSCPGCHLFSVVKSPRRQASVMLPIFEWGKGFRCGSSLRLDYWIWYVQMKWIVNNEFFLPKFQMQLWMG